MRYDVIQNNAKSFRTSPFSRFHPDPVRLGTNQVLVKHGRLHPPYKSRKCAFYQDTIMLALTSLEMI